MEKLGRGVSDVVTDRNSNLTLVRWKDNKVVTVASTFVVKMLLSKAHGSVKAQNGRAETDQPRVFSYIIKVWEELITWIKTAQINSYMIGHRGKKWCSQFSVLVWIY